MTESGPVVLRTLADYKDGGGGAFGLVGMGHRFMTHMQTERERERDRRREASVERWAERRDILTRKARAAKRRRPQPRIQAPGSG